jgi:hypothetical protein
MRKVCATELMPRSQLTLVVVLHYLEGMSREGDEPDTTAPRSLADSEDYQRLLGNQNSPHSPQRIYSPAPRSQANHTLPDLPSSPTRYTNGNNVNHDDINGDDADSNVQEGVRSEGGDTALPLVSLFQRYFSAPPDIHHSVNPALMIHLVPNMNLTTLGRPLETLDRCRWTMVFLPHIPPGMYVHSQILSAYCSESIQQTWMHGFGKPAPPVPWSLDMRMTLGQPAKVPVSDVAKSPSSNPRPLQSKASNKAQSTFSGQEAPTVWSPFKQKTLILTKVSLASQRRFPITKSGCH